MNLFEVYARITLDTSEYERGLSEAESKTNGFGGKIASGFGKIAKVGAAAVGAASAGLVAFGKSSVEVGMEFDSSMSQVAATMNKTMSELESEIGSVDTAFGEFEGNLRDYAKFMGQNTSFSASQAAEALNFMALAGYDAQTSMEMLPNVLNLAAAGSMELATASDMVTDTQSALGLSLEETTQLVDKMAKASSSSNTSVQQLGEAMLTVGGTAKELKGGTTELSAALGILADNGVKGAEGGTALRNIILSLSAPTDKAASDLERLGVAVFDSSGNMRGLNEIFTDLNNSLGEMSSEDKINALNNIFNKTDLKSVNALLANSTDRFDELAAAIDDAQGSAQQMADTQLDNLAGQITLMQSAMESLQIAISDNVAPSLRDFVEIGSQGFSDMATAIDAGDWDGAMDAFGNTLAKLVNSMAEKIPRIIEMGAGIVAAFIEGIGANLGSIASAAVSVIQTIGTGIINGLPQIISFGANILTSLGQGILQNMPMMVENALAAVENFTSGLGDNLGMIIDAGVDFILSLANGIVMSIPSLIEHVPTIISNVVSAIGDNLPKILEAGIELIFTLGQGLIAAIPDLIANIPKIISAIWNTITAVNWLELGWTIIKGIASGILGLLETVVSAGARVVTVVKNAISEKVSEFINIGKNLIQGLWKGIESAKDWIVGKVKGLGSSIVNAAKSVLGIHSPSTVFRDEVGYNIGLGIAEGIDASKDEALKAADDLAKDVFSKSQKWADRYIKFNKASTEDQLEIWTAIQEQFVEGSEQWWAAEEKIFDLREKIANDNEALLEKIAKEEETRKKNEYNNTKKQYDREFKLNRTSTSDQLNIWEKFWSTLEKGSDEWLEIEEKIFDIREKLVSEYVNKLENFSDDVKKIYDEIDKIESDYTKAVDDRTAEIFKSYGVFDQISERAIVSGKQLSDNLLGQVYTMEEFYENLDKLSARGVNEDLVEEIRAMGPEAVDELAALVSMSDKELKNYSDLYGKKQKLANDQALKELSKLKTETEKKVKEQLKELDNLYKTEAPSVGQAMTDGIAQGIKSGQSDVINSAVAMAQAAISAVKDTLGIASPSKVFSSFGMFSAQGYAVGWEDEFSSVKSQIESDMAFNPQGVDFGSSGLGMSSAGIINASMAQSAGASQQNFTIKLMLPDGTELASYLLGPLSKFARAQGTPIINPA